MKRLIALTLLAALALPLIAGCRRAPALPTEPPETRLTTPYGDVIPHYEELPRSTLDPALFSWDARGRAVYNDPAVKTMTGVDVSVFQGDIDWQAVKADGVEFAMLRVGYRGYGTEGKLGEDEKFAENYAAATAAGLAVGVYFFSQAVTEREAKEEADFVLGHIEGLALECPVAYDWEHIDYDTARTDGLSNEQISLCAAAFCERIHSAGRSALVYFNRELGYFEFDLSAVADYPFWIAEYTGAPSFIYDFRIWQYSKTGSVDGITGNVDMNLAFSFGA